MRVVIKCARRSPKGSTRMASRNKGKQRSQEDSKTKQSTTVEGERLVIDKWDSAAVKNALDDTAKKV